MRRERISTELAADLLEFSRGTLAIHVPGLLLFLGLSRAGVAQLVEHLICNQRVGGSIPSASSTRICRGAEAERVLERKINGLVSLDTSPFCVFSQGFCKRRRLKHLNGIWILRDGWVSG